MRFFSLVSSRTSLRRNSIGGLSNHRSVRSQAGPSSNGSQLPPGPGFEHPWGTEEFRKNAHEIVDFIVDYYRDVQSGTYPVRSTVEPGYLTPLLPTACPEEGESFRAILSDVQSKIIPGLTHWQHPSFFAYFSANSSYPGLLGEFLSGAFNVIGFSWVGSPACTELETIALDWLGKLLGLPIAFLNETGTGGGGVIQGTASEAVLVALLAARARTLGAPPAATATATATTASSLSAAPPPPSQFPRLVAYTSDQAHSCVKKACMIAGIEHLRLIPAAPEDHWAMRADRLEAQMGKDRAAGLIPFFVCASFGTTSSGAVDPLGPIADVAARFDAWVHVDAAYAGSALVLPEMRPFASGLEKADSFAFNPHKWLLTNFDLSAMYVKSRAPVIDALSLTPEFLRNKATDAGAVIDYKDWQVPLGRRFRALKLWMVLRSYGANKLREYIRHHVSLARAFEALVRADPRFEVTTPTHFSLVCFRLKAGNDASRILMDRVNGTGATFLTHTALGGVFTLRMAICGSYTTWEHVEATWELLRGHADEAVAQAAKEAASTAVKA